ncbi:MAG: response regulator transcription factor [Mesorhizobium sp.]|nr:MAG: response regulator transcription factor [Mesorhizobium sp.]RWK98756.1 MAG: response regulator transcription factor [Mesorhizobium sp.]RWL02221.1 MAG: response regulator transcription factor [Mesorhizobium sp.]TIP24518.1 MAG: response regulator transcription factor [Mesorhizobium sp.]TIP81022.1 MAG: response regulator transcription factor [Mesorhizobium sp.]
MHVFGAASMQEWKGVQEHHPPLAAILFNAGGRRFTDQTVVNEVTHLVSDFRSVPVAVLADSEDVTDLLKALDCGVRGYIPTSVGIDVCIEAINLAIAGGTFVPASGLLAFRQALDGKVSEPNRISAMFTPRQVAVAKALRQGKPNKIIAYELNKCEGTVKVHVRSIMKKLKATNRTEVAYKINGLAGSDARLS